VGVNPTRRAAIDFLVRMGARIDESAAGTGPAAMAPGSGEPLADLTVHTSQLQAIDLGPEEVAMAVDEIPILCLAATQARGRTTIRGAGELRNKESDRIAGIPEGCVPSGPGSRSRETTSQSRVPLRSSGLARRPSTTTGWP